MDQHGHLRCKSSCNVDHTLQNTVEIHSLFSSAQRQRELEALMCEMCANVLTGEKARYTAQSL